MSTTREAVATVLDQAGLSELVEAPVRATRLRVKPGVSVVFALLDPASARTWGWGRLLWPESHVKAALLARKALRHGLRTTERRLSPELVLQTGRVSTDPRLLPHLRAAFRLGVLPERRGTSILRYNPLRRLVVHHGQEVVRVTTSPQDQQIALTELLAQAVPVPPRTGVMRSQLHQGTHLSAVRYVGDGDLGARPDHQAAVRAGAALARLHRYQVPQVTAPASTQRLAQVHAEVLSALDPSLAAQVLETGAALPALAEPGSRPVLSHGDFSPDQVLVDRDHGQVWLTDFERLCRAPAALDLGSFLSLAPPGTGAALLEGYADAGGQPPPQPLLQAGALRSRLARLTEPLRRGAPDWHEQVSKEARSLREAAGRWSPHGARAPGPGTLRHLDHHTHLA